MIRPPSPNPPARPVIPHHGTGAAPSPRPRIALAHDWLCGYRGGEAVLDRIARLAARRGEPAGLYTMFNDRRTMTPAIDALSRHVSLLGLAPGASTTLRRWLLPLYPAAVADLSRSLALAHRRAPVDLLISTSSAAVKGLRPPISDATGRPVPHLCYCHSPARYLWSQTEQYARGRGGGLRALGLRTFGDRLRRWDTATAGERHVTRFIANSTHTAAEIRRCYGREAPVVFPPVRTDLFTPGPGAGGGKGGRGGRGGRDDFWLVVGALEPYKRVDLAVEAARLAGRRLLIAGRGSQESALRAGAGEHVTFLGRVPDAELRRLYRTADLLLFPQVEDFGIVAVEAQACGLPVVARRAGGALDSVIDGVTGALFDDETPESVAEAAARAPRDPAACRANAERFSEAAFDAAMLGHIEELLGGTEEGTEGQRHNGTG